MALGIISVQASGMAASLAALIIGVLVLAFPTLLRYLVGLYLLFIGLLGLVAQIL